jgi:RNA polymerase sigma factor (sigma-70 family)
MVEAAQAGNRQAQDDLVAAYLPLVYNIVGRALNGHADVDDVVQETMLRAVDGLAGLRDPASFRSWLVAIAMNQIRGRWQAHQRETLGGPDAFFDVADPRLDFVELTIVRLGLSGQRREVAEATRWLDADDREVLSLWWLEAAGELTRAELAAALDLPPQHAAVRIQRMKNQLETSRVVVRALLATPRCYDLDTQMAGWDGLPSPLWRKRFARHARECPVCSGFGGDLVPAERLLVALALVPPAAGLASLVAATRHAVATHATAGQFGTASQPFAHSLSQPTQSGPPSAPHVRSGHAHRRPRHGLRRLSRHPLISSAAAGVTAVAAIAAVVYGTSDNPGGKARATDSLVVTQSAPSTSAPRTPSPSTSPSTAPRQVPTSAATPGTTPTTTSKPKPSPTTSTSSAALPASNASAAQQVLDLINKARADQGLPALTLTDGLGRSSLAHNQTMAGGCGMSHQCPGELDLGARETAAGVHWSAAGENIGEGGPVGTTPQKTADMAVALTQDMLNEKPPNDGHRRNILSSTFTHIGIAVFRDAKGTVWLTQDFSD